LSFSYDFPKAFNFAGQGGTIGHELVHGFDDEGKQYPITQNALHVVIVSSMVCLCNCTSMECGWMDDEARDGFRDMAQCVVMQYNTQCCPEKKGNVHCANGATTQGENIADLGGQQAAYIAYQEYIKGTGKEEKR
ncbi:peptidase family M13, partial [Cooperia oncophora]